jgi:hypothetical protein
MERGETGIACVEDRWRLDEEWWRGSPVSRQYFHVLLEDGRRTTLFHDLIEGLWYEQRYA